MGAVLLRGPLAAGLGQGRHRRVGRGARAHRRSARRTRAADPARPPRAVRLSVLSGRGDRRRDRAGPRCAGTGSTRAASPSTPPTSRSGSPAARGDAARRPRVYDDVVAVLGRIWHEWFSARIRLAAVTLGAIAGRCRSSARPSAPSRPPTSTGCTATATPCCDRYADPSGHWGPEGRAWTKRLDAETLRARWLAGVDAPPQDALVDAWRDAEQLFADFGHVHELAAGPGHAGRASCAPPATRPAPASSATWPGRPPRRSARSRCSTS